MGCMLHKCLAKEDVVVGLNVPTELSLAFYSIMFFVFLFTHCQTLSVSRN